MGGNRVDQPDMAPGEAESLKIPAEGSHLDGAVQESERIARGLGTGGGAGQSFYDPAHPQPSHDSNVHALEGRAQGDADDDKAEAERSAKSEKAEKADKAELSPREREAQGTEDPRERGVGA